MFREAVLAGELSPRMANAWDKIPLRRRGERVGLQDVPLGVDVLGDVALDEEAFE